MKRLWVALVLLGVSLVLFLGTPAFSDRVGGLTQALSKLTRPDLQRTIEKVGARFTDNEDGTVTDNLTGLVWMKHASDKANFLGFGPETSWADACAACNALEHGEHGLTDRSRPGDWRLPNVRELQRLVDYSEYNPPLPAGHPFLGVHPYVEEGSSHYWSSTTNPMWSGDWANAYILDFDTGSVSSRFKSGEPGDYVWCVRGGQLP